MALSGTVQKQIEAEIDTMKRQRDALDARIQEAEKGLAALRGAAGPGRRTGKQTQSQDNKGAGPARSKRIRRSKEQLQAEAAQIHQLVKQAGKAGISGGEIRKTHPGVGINIKGFMKKWGHPLTVKGKRAAMRYFAS